MQESGFNLFGYMYGDVVKYATSLYVIESEDHNEFTLKAKDGSDKYPIKCPKDSPFLHHHIIEEEKKEKKK